MDITNNVTLIQSCVSSNTASTCDEGCQWRHGRDSNGTHSDIVPLFSEDFCHPVQVSGNTSVGVWDNCVTKPTAPECSITTGCNWSTGKELIPDHDFCAPMDLTTDATLIQKCVSTGNATDCRDGCAWRHGKNYNGDNTHITDIPLFSTDFCHPVNASTSYDSWATCIDQ